MKKSTVVSVIGLLTMFVAFVLFQTWPLVLFGTVKFTDVLTLVGGLMFIIPVYLDSVKRKRADNAPNPVVWSTLPPIGMAVVCVGILIPNSLTFFHLFSLPDVFYLVGCLMMLPIFLYPMSGLERAELEETVEEEVDEAANSTAAGGKKRD